MFGANRFTSGSKGQHSEAVSGRPATDGDALTEASISSAASNPYRAPVPKEVRVKDLAQSLERVVNNQYEQLLEGCMPLVDYYELVFESLQGEGVMTGEFNFTSFSGVHRLLERCKRWQSLAPYIGDSFHGVLADYVGLEGAPREVAVENDVVGYTEISQGVSAHLTMLGNELTDDLIRQGVAAKIEGLSGIPESRQKLLQKYLQTDVIDDLSYHGFIGRHLSFTPSLYADHELFAGSSGCFAVHESAASEGQFLDAIRLLARRRK